MTTGRSPHGSRRDGFSLIELVVVIAVAGILAAVVGPRLIGRQGFESRGFHDQALAVVRFAQKTAVAQRTNVFVVISGSRIAACYDAGCASRVVSPFSLPKTSDVARTNCGGDATWLCAGSPSSEVTVSAAAASYSFDGLGRPSFAAPLVITVASTAPGDPTRTLTVEAETGYVRQP